MYIVGGSAYSSRPRYYGNHRSTYARGASQEKFKMKKSLWVAGGAAAVGFAFYSECVESDDV